MNPGKPDSTIESENHNLTASKASKPDDQGFGTRTSAAKVVGAGHPAPHASRINLMTVPRMPSHPIKPLRGAMLHGVRGAATLVAGVFACALALVTPSAANDAVGWGLLTFNSRDTTPFRVGDEKEVVQISCGGGHTLALRKDPSLPSVAPCSSTGGGICKVQEGVVVGWGFNEFGQATVGLETDQTTGVVRPWSAIQVAAGYAHSMRLYREQRDGFERDGGAVDCWGDNSFGQCWVPEEVRHPYRSATDPTLDRPVVQIAAGYNFSIALMRDGTLRGWGDNNSGQLDFPVWTEADAPKPNLVGQPIRFYKVVAGGSHVIGLVALNQYKGDFGGLANTPRKVLAWGGNFSGQCSTPSMYVADSIGGFISKQLVAVDIAAGLSHSLALTGTGTSSGGTLLYQSPSDPAAKLPVRAGLILAWGDDSYGQATPPHMRSKTSAFYRSWDLNRRITWKALAAGGYHSAAVDSNGYVYCWGLGNNGTEQFGDYGQVNDDLEKTNVNYRQPQLGVECDLVNVYPNTQLISAGLYHTGVATQQWNLKSGAGENRLAVVPVTWGRNYEAQCGVPYETNYKLSVTKNRQIPAIFKGTTPRSRQASDLRAVWAGGFMPNRLYGFFSDFTVGLDYLNKPVGWGDNVQYQRDFFAATSPVTLTPSLKYKLLAPGGHFTWLLDTTGKPHFIGDPVFAFSRESDTPKVAGFLEVSAGAFHTLFRKSSGVVQASGGAPSAYWDDSTGQEVMINWGQGSYSADDEFLGDADGIRTMPSLLAQKISAGWFHSTALALDGSVKCWGAGETRFMDPAMTGLSNTPNFGQSVVPGDLPACTEVAAGGYHTVALTKETGAGKVRVWGSNNQGQLNNSAIRTTVVGSDAVVLRRVDGMVRAWGNLAASTSGQLDADGTRVASVYAGFGTTGTIDGSGNALLFGAITDVPTYEPEPGKVLPMKFSSLGIGEAHVVGLRTDGSVVCWGSNTYGQVRGVDKNGPVTDPLKLRRIHDGENSDICNGSLCTGNDKGTIASEIPLDPFDLIRINKGTMGDISDDIDYCTSFPTSDSCDIGLTDDLLYAVQVAAGSRHSLALRVDGTLQAWGAWQKTSKTIGSVVSNTPTGGYSITKIVAGADHNVALRISGSISMWGSNSYGQIQPLFVPGGLINIVDIGAGDRHTVILKNDGKVYAWGDSLDGAGQPADSPARIPEGQRGVAVAAGGRNTIVLQDRFTPIVIGELASETVPTLDDTPLRAVAVRAGGFHSAALLEDGTVTTWGAGQNAVGSFPDYGQSTPPRSSLNPVNPLQVEQMSAAYPNTISAGALSTVVLRARLPFSLTGEGAPGADGGENLLPDFDGDGCVTMTDLGVLMLEFGNMAWPGGDLDGNGEIDMGDISLLQMQLGECTEVAEPTEAD